LKTKVVFLSTVNFIKVKNNNIFKLALERKIYLLKKLSCHPMYRAFKVGADAWIDDPFPPFCSDID